MGKSKMQAELAQKLGISYKDLTDIENNKRKPNKKLLRRIAKICGFDISVFGLDNMTRGEKIKYFREKSGLSQEALASQIVNLSESELAQIEENRKKISGQMYLQVSKILQFSDSSLENKTAGDIIKHHRIRAGLTQRELSNKAGVSSSTLSRIEKNNRNYKNKSLFKIVCALELNPCLFDSLIVPSVTNLSRGQIIRSYRKAAGLSLDDLANKVGKSRAYINFIEKDEREASDSTLRSIAEALSIDTTTLSIHSNNN